MGLLQTVAPAEEPVSLVTAKLHCRVDTTDEDSLFTALIAAARQYCENFTRRQLVTATWNYLFDYFPDGDLRIPLPPISSLTVDIVIQYRDVSDVVQTFAAANYQVDGTVTPAKIRLHYGKSWPSTYPRPLACNVSFVCGYGAASAVPAAIRQAMLLLIGHWYTNRQDVVTGTIATKVHRAVDALLMPFKTGWIDFSTNKVEAA